MGTNVGEVDELEMEFLESTSVRNWMEMWLRALSDHVRIVSDMSVLGMFKLMSRSGAMWQRSVPSPISPSL